MRFYFALSFLFVSLFILQPYNLSAQVEIQSDSLFVDEIEFEEKEYSVGGMVNGKFKLFNTGSEVITGIHYRIELIEVTEYDGVPYPSESFDSSSLSDAVTINASEAKSFSFVYKLPENLPEGTLAIAVQTYLGNTQTPSAYEYKLINTSGPKVKMLESTAFVTINNKEIYEPLEGPTVGSTEEIALQVVLQSSSEVSLIPTLRIYKGNNTNTPVLKEETLYLRV